VEEHWVEPYWEEAYWEPAHWDLQADYAEMYDRFEALQYPWAVDICMDFYRYDATFDYYEHNDYDHDHETTIDNFLCIVDNLKHTHGFTEQPEGWIPIYARIVKTYGFDPPAWMIADYTKDQIYEVWEMFYCLMHPYECHYGEEADYIAPETILVDYGDIKQFTELIHLLEMYTDHTTNY